MPKNIIIASESSSLYSTRRLLEEGSKLKYSTIWINPYETPISNLDKIALNGLYMLRTTGIRYDDYDLACAKNYSLYNYKIINPLDPAKLFRSKELQSIFFKEHQLESIPTVMYRGALTDEIWDMLQKLSPTSQFILKMNRGNQGIGVNLINGLQSLRSFLETFHAMKDQRFLIQPYLPHQKELRIFMIKNEVHAIIEKSISSDDFRGNAKRSTGKLIQKIPNNILDEIERAYKLSQLNYCGIDLIWGADNTFSFLEINPVPGFEQIELLSKKNIAGEIITQLK
jgi:ribosomal protein S6--L-glutamate ligase